MLQYQLEVHFFGTIASQKKKKKLITFYYSKKRAKEKVMELSTAANFFQQKDTHFLDYLCRQSKVLLKTATGFYYVRGRSLILTTSVL